MPSFLKHLAPNPIVRKRLARFRQLKRGWWSFLLFALLYLLTLGAELVCNSRPLLLHHDGKWLFPAFRFYPESAFQEDGTPNRADYLRLNTEGAFQDDFVLWTLCRNDPYRIIAKEELLPHLRAVVRITPEPRVASLTLLPDLTIASATGLESFLLNDTELPPCEGIPLAELWKVPDDFAELLASRWRGETADSLSIELLPRDTDAIFPPVMIVFPAAAPRSGGRKSLRARALEELPKDNASTQPRLWRFRKGEDTPISGKGSYESLPLPLRNLAEELRSAQEISPNREERTLDVEGRTYRLTAETETAQFPFRPIPGHWMGIDSAGRDVFARVFYGLRVALNFGMLLVFFSLAGGTFAGMLQGYRGGITDLAGQRFIEIWSALPFLYVMILMGSIYGAGFALLLVCYALFNWIGISHYMRAETLRLRKMPFVEAARCIGLSGWAIAWKHILPNALVPLITLFPFSLVGAIGSLAALDYLGFGLPAPTPSLGELLAQAQADRTAWWLTLYPSLALFAVMLLGVFIGEGIRNAFDPRRQQRIQ